MTSKLVPVFLSLTFLSNPIMAQNSSITPAQIAKSESTAKEGVGILGLATIWLALVHAYHGPKFVESRANGNDLIIFSAYKKDGTEEFNEGLKHGGTVLGAIKQCLVNKESHEKSYGIGICEKIEKYAPVQHVIETAIWKSVVYVLIPCATVTAGVLATGGVCIYKKLKKD